MPNSTMNKTGNAIVQNIAMRSRENSFMFDTYSFRKALIPLLTKLEPWNVPTLLSYALARDLQEDVFQRGAAHIERVELYGARFRQVGQSAKRGRGIVRIQRQMAVLAQARAGDAFERPEGALGWRVAAQVELHDRFVEVLLDKGVRRVERHNLAHINHRHAVA